jgi:Rrf2 family protein
MLITRKADYAVRCVLYLSKDPEQVASVNDIAKNMHIPKTFLAKILQLLMKAGIVESNRGIKGGFKLTKSPGDISLYDVVVAVEGPIATNMCAVDKKVCRLSNSCVVHPIWVDLKKEIEERMKKENFLRLLKRS